MSETPAAARPPVTDHHAYVRRRLVVNAGSSVVANVWAIVVSLAVVPVLYAGLGPDLFGMWAVLQIFSAVTGWFSLVDLGVGVATTREIARADSTHDAALRVRTTASSIWFFLGVGVVSGIVFAVGGIAFVVLTGMTTDRPELHLEVVVVLMAAQILVDVFSRSFIAILEGAQRTDAARLGDGVRRTFVACASAAAAASAGTLVAVMAAALAAAMIGAFVTALLCRRVGYVVIRGGSVATLKSLLRQGVPIAVLRPLGVIQRTMDRVVVAMLIGASGVAAVEIATNLQSGPDAILSASSQSVTPGASYLLARHDHAGLQGLLLRGTRLSLLVALPVATLVATMSGPLIDVWIGDDAPEYTQLLGTLAGLSIAILSSAAVSSNLLIGIFQASAVLRAASISIVINLVGSIVLAIAIGTPGVFVATLGSVLVLTPMLLRSASAAVAVDVSTVVKTSIVRGAIPSLGLAACLVALRHACHSALTCLAVGALLGVPVVGILTWVVGLDSGERSRVRSLTVARRSR